MTMTKFGALIFISVFLMTCEVVPSDGLTSTDDSGQPELTVGDFPDAEPCLNRDTLPDDETFLNVLENATTILHIHKKYQNDDNLPEVCGLGDEDNKLEETESAWNPLTGDDVVICYDFTTSLIDRFSIEDMPPGICRSNYSFESVDTLPGFPRAGTYRLDACVENETDAYEMRVRATVSGENVNKTLAQLEITDTTSLSIFDPDDVQITSSEQAKELILANPEGFPITLRSVDSLKTHLEIILQIICVNKLVGFCPTATEACLK